MGTERHLVHWTEHCTRATSLQGLDILSVEFYYTLIHPVEKGVEKEMIIDDYSSEL